MKKGWFEGGEVLYPYKGHELDLKIVCNRKISNNKSLLTVNSNGVLLGDTIICKTNQIEDSTPWFCSIGLLRLISHGTRWTNTLQNNFAQCK